MIGYYNLSLRACQTDCKFLVALLSTFPMQCVCLFFVVVFILSFFIYILFLFIFSIFVTDSLWQYGISSPLCILKVFSGAVKIA